MANFGKAPSSRFIKFQNLQWTGTGTLVSTTFTAQTYQVRVTSQLAGWICIGTSTSTDPLLGTLPTTNGGVGAYMPNTTVQGEYFTCPTGGIFSFASTTTSSGQWVSVAEMG
jgi:hypothetical protein